MLGPYSDVSLHFPEILKSKNRDQKTIYNTFGVVARSFTLFSDNVARNSSIKVVCAM